LGRLSERRLMQGTCGGCKRVTKDVRSFNDWNVKNPLKKGKRKEKKKRKKRNVKLSHCKAYFFFSPMKRLSQSI
jgi:hypothetical protein